MCTYVYIPSSQLSTCLLNNFFNKQCLLKKFLSNNTFADGETLVDRSELELALQAVTDELANELIELTPEFMNKIQFEIVSTDDGGADIALMEIHPEVP
jgi:hypothetical protein